MLASPLMDTALPCAHAHWLPYTQRLDARPLNAIDLVVIHCTELPDLAMAREFGEREPYASGTGNSGHFYIDRDGNIEQYVPLERIAHHVRGYNPRSVGIELVNTGRWPHWLAAGRQDMEEDYTPAQMTALAGLLEELCSCLHTLSLIAGHEDLTGTRYRPVMIPRCWSGASVTPAPASTGKNSWDTPGCRGFTRPTDCPDPSPARRPGRPRPDTIPVAGSDIPGAA